MQKGTAFTQLARVAQRRAGLPEYKDVSREVRQELWVTVAVTFELFLIFLVVIAAITLLSEVARLPPAKEPKKKFLKHLLHSKPILPKHQPPPPLKQGVVAPE